MGNLFCSLKKELYQVSQIALLEVIIICGLVFLIPVYFIEMSLGYKIVLEIPFILTLTYVVLFPELLHFYSG